MINANSQDASFVYLSFSYTVISIVMTSPECQFASTESLSFVIAKWKRITTFVLQTIENNKILQMKMSVFSKQRRQEKY